MAIALRLLRTYLVCIALVVQAALLFPKLDLLPMWGDEHYTLQTAARPPAEILDALRLDVHPPLYYFLVKAWLKLPLPGDAVVRVRALSVVIALAATAALYRLWLRSLSFEARALFLGLWVASPFLTLYARMARSYTLQLLMAMVAIHAARRWLPAPADTRRMWRYIAAEIALLYTHYLPGLAVAAGTAALGLARRRWQHLIALGAIGVAYIPWMTALFSTSSRVMRGTPYWQSSNPLVENCLKLAYTFVAFNFGESIPPWGIVLGLVLLPAIAFALWNAWQRTGDPPLLLLVVATVAFLGASRWVTFAFVGARLLFLLPFYFLFLLRGVDVRRWYGAVTYGGLLLVFCGGLASYYRRQDFLNKGYIVDFDRIVAALQQESPHPPAVVLLDAQLSEAGYVLHQRVPARVETLANRYDFDRALVELRHHRPALVWYLRYDRDMAGGLHGILESELERDFQVERRYFVPFSWLDRRAMEWLGQKERPTHLVEVLVLRLRPRLLPDVTPADRMHDGRNGSLAERRHPLPGRDSGV